MTWNSITPQKFVELVNYWVNQDWPLTEDKLTAAMEKLGWDESDPSTIAKDIPVSQPRLRATTSDPVRGLDMISWSLTDIDTTKSIEQYRFMNDAFVGYVEAGTAFGVDLESSVTLSVKLHTGRQKMVVSFKYPIGVQLSQYISIPHSMRMY